MPTKKLKKAKKKGPKSKLIRVPKEFDEMLKSLKGKSTRTKYLKKHMKCIKKALKKNV